jgi:RNA polymerase sigma factor (sigma-70 family)
MSTTVQPLTDYAARDLSTALNLALSLLPSNYADVVRLHRLQNRRQQETADLLGTTKTAVARILKDALRMLRSHFDARRLCLGDLLPV